MWEKEALYEGWYFWRKSKVQEDPWKWHAYFIDEDGCCWENGTEVYPPNGGWWGKIPMLMIAMCING